MTDLPKRLEPLRLAPGVHLAEWQANAVAAWRRSRHPERGPRHGIIEAVTGTGKTLAAIACMVDAVAEVPGLRVAVVVPGQQLALQWESELKSRLGLADRDVGVRMTGRTASLSTHRIVVWVIDSARTGLAKDCAGLDVLLVVDECHRSGSEQNLRIYEARTRFRLGLSATAQRQGEFDHEGLLLPLERQSHAKELGPTLEPRITVALAEQMGILPPFKLVHHGLSLSPKEMEDYQQLSRNVTRASDEAERLGLTRGGVFAAIKAGPGHRYSAAQHAAALDVQRALLARKHFLYLRPERSRVAALIVAEALAARPSGSQALLFHERIAPTKNDFDDAADPDFDDTLGAEVPTLQQDEANGADQLFDHLQDLAAEGRLSLANPPTVAIRRHHTAHPDPAAFDAMRLPLGDPERAQILVSVRGAVEGVDLPSADLGVVVASSSSVRQRIQTLGRILRPLRGKDGRPAPRSAYEGLPPRTLHLLYIRATVDTEIYKGTDWDELLGAERNEFLRWEFGAEQPGADEDPPQPPASDEVAAAWALSEWAQAYGVPVPWIGRQPSVDVQPLFYKANAVRARRDGPAVPGGEAVALIVDQAAEALGRPSTELRGPLFLRLTDGLVIRATPASLTRLNPVKLPGSDREIPVRWLVLGRFVGRFAGRNVGGWREC